MYEFYLDGILLPVAPSKIEKKMRNQNQTVTMMNEGEINILKQPGLTEVSFTCLLPNQRYPFAKYPNDEFQDGIYYLGLLEQLKLQCKPFSFVIVRTKTNGDFVACENRMQVSLEDYTITEEATNSGDFEVKITLSQYRPYGTKTLNFKDEEKQETTVTETRDGQCEKPREYTIESGDTLWGIAKRYLGYGNRYPEIYALNEAVIEAAAKQHGKASSSKGNLIFPGTVIKLPQ